MSSYGDYDYNKQVAYEQSTGPDGYRPAPVGYQQAPATDQPSVQAQAAQPMVEYQPYPAQTAYPHQEVMPYEATSPYGPAYQPYAAPLPVEDPGKNLAVAGLVIGLAGWWVPFVGFLAPILAIALGATGLQRSKAVGRSNGVAVGAIVVGVATLLLGVLVIGIGLMAMAYG